MPAAEKLLAAGAAGVLFAFIADNRWKALFKFSSAFYQGWMHTLAFFGSIIVLALIITKLLGIKVVDAALHPKLVVLFGVLPALGFVIDELRRLKFMGVVFLAGIVVMAYAAAKITSRDNILK